MKNPVTEHNPSSTSRSSGPCLHRRAIDDVLTKDGRKTGAIRCVECGMIIADPRVSANAGV